MDNLQQASFRGVTFHCKESSTSANRKLAVYELPHANRRVYADLGLKPLSFNITGFFGAREGQSYQDKRRAILKAFYEDGGSGLFIHPIHGSFLAVISGFVLNESQSAVGKGSFTCTVLQVDEVLQPQETADNVALVESLVIPAQNAASDALARDFKVLAEDSFGFAQAKEAVCALGEKFNGALDGVFVQGDTLSQVAGEIESFISSSTSFLTRPQELARATERIFNGLRNCATDTKERFKLFNSFFSPVKTAGDAGSYFARLRAGNLAALALNQNVQAQVLALATVKEMEFSTQDELENVLSALTEQQENIFSATDDDVLVGALEELKTQVWKYAETLGVPGVSQVETALTTPALLSYSYYGSLENEEKLAALNNLQDVTFIKGKVKILNE